MGRYLTEETVENLIIEVTAQRLVMRSLLAYIALTTKQSLAEMIADFQIAAEKTSPDIVPLPDVERGVHEKASALAKARAEQFIQDLGRLTAKLPPNQPVIASSRTHSANRL